MTSTILSLLNAQAIDEYYRKGYWRDETIYAAVRLNADRAPDHPAIRDRFRRLSFGELVLSVDGFAADLAGRGVKPGQRVTFWMPDRIESVVALLACSRNGYVCCPSPHRNHTVAEVATLMERMQTAALIYQTGFGADTDRHDIVAEIGNLASLRHVYQLPPTDPSCAGEPPFAGLLAEPPAAEADMEPPVDDPNRVGYLAFTSGSTGRPKGVMHSDNTLLLTAKAIARDWHVDSDSVVYSLSPFSHNLGIGTMLTSLVSGAEYVVHDLDRRRESLADRLVETGTTYLAGVPTHAIDLLAEMHDRGLTGLGRLRGFRISGAATPPQVMTELLERGVIPQSGYGMTETNAHQYTLPDDDPSLIMETSGRVCDGYEVAIWDAEDPDVAMPPGEIGQVGGRGACLMLGYFDDQIATEAAFNVHGWFMTGDLGWLDENGYLRLTGRKKEVIIRGGHNINPARIEELAMQHETVERAAAIPVADSRLGERVCLAVMYRRGADNGFDKVLDHLAAAGLSKYEMPELYLELADIPLMSNGKIQKLDIMRWIADGRVEPAAVRR